MAEKKKIILSIEAIRGIAAIYVMLGHIVQLYQVYSYFPGYEFAIKTVFGYGHQAVLLFFIVSGFSITYSSYDIDLSDKESLKVYFFKRFRRIYPLFLIVLLFSLLVLKITAIPSDLKRNVLSFLFLTDNASGSIADPIPTNYPIWSLSYEVVYYLLYPVLVFVWSKLGQKKTLIIILGISIVSGLLGFAGWPNHIFNILQYYWIWIAGAMLADAYVHEKKFGVKFLKGLLISSIAIMLTIEEIPIVAFWFWSFFFILLFLLFYSDNQELSKGARIMNFSIGIGSVAICYFLTFFEEIVYHDDLLRIILMWLGIFTAVLYFIPEHFLKKSVRAMLNPFVRSGSFSYALYILHWPLITLAVFLYSKYFSSSFLVMFVFIAINILIIILTSWFLEERLQPVFVRYLNKVYYRKSSSNLIISSKTSQVR